MIELNHRLREEKSSAFVLNKNSTSLRTLKLNLWGQERAIYTNANLSIYSAQTCNARCAFCVEELRPSSRGIELSQQKQTEPDDERYFSRLEEVLSQLKLLNPSVSMTGGEISKDPRLPRILRLLEAHGARKRTLTTNGSGLLDIRESKRVVEWIAETGVSFLNISIAHFDLEQNQRLMRYKQGPQFKDLIEIVKICRQNGVRVRLSCVLLKDEVDTLPRMRSYLEFAASLGVDNVIFRQLMKTDPNAHLSNYVVKYCDQKRVDLRPLLESLHAANGFSWQKQIVGYYYYVEVWRFNDIDVVFEEADLAQLEKTKLQNNIIHELIFHPNARLASTWQPWDGLIY